MINQINELDLLSLITKALFDNSEPIKIIQQLTHVFAQIFYVTDFSIYTLNKQTGEMRDFIRNWIKFGDDMKNKPPYSLLPRAYKNTFILNNNIFTMDATITGLDLKNFISNSNTMVVPLYDKSSLIGFINIVFDDSEVPQFTPEFVKAFRILTYQIASAIINYQLNEQMKITAEFYGALKNIAKIIETQYDLTFVIPMIGEMIDRFVSEHLIYIFIKENNNFKLVWPSSFNDAMVRYSLTKLDKLNPQIIMNEGKVGLFALFSDKKVMGAVVAYSPVEKLSKKTTDYIKQLTNQASTTIQKAAVYAEILKYASFDALTNLNNRRQFEMRLGQEVATARRKKTDLSCIMIDIDHFKKVNDTYGHAVGDYVLSQVAKMITGTIREYDIASRYGGEEFCILLPHTKMDEAAIVAERLRKTVESTVLDIQSVCEFECDNFNVTISMGVNEYEQDYTTNEQIYKNADKALYRAKKSGRNRVVTYSPSFETDGLDEEEDIGR